jgi:predicted dehydrogenase
VLKGLVGGAGAAVACPRVITSSALGAQGGPPARERIVMGFIGPGDRGMLNLRTLMSAKEVQVVAVCEVDAGRRAKAKAVVDEHYGNKDCAACNDFRDLLARDDIDAVDVSTPDQWHAIPTIEACRRGKDVHVEKPLSLTIQEGRAMVQAARRYGRVVQTGSEARSNPSCRFACELVRNGRIGKVREVYVGGVGPPATTDVLPGEPVPAGLDWDLWLGPAPWRPYNPRYHPYNWRWFHDFSGGGLTDWGAHHFDLAQWALGMDDTGPVEVHPPDEKDRKWLTYVYASGVRMHHVLKDPPPLMLGAITVVGDRGRVGFWYGGLNRTDPPGLAKETIGPDEIHLHVCPPGGHERGDFLTAVRTRRKPGADVEIGHRSVTVAHLGGICYRLNRSLKWDPVKEEFIGDAEANRMRSRSMREPWRL